MKKKIAIVDNLMIVGGVEKACIALLDAFDHERYEVHYFTHTANNPYLDQINKNVKLHSLEELEPVSVHRQLKRGQLGAALRGAAGRIAIRLCKSEFEKARHAYQTYAMPRVKFDLAIAFRLNYPDVAITLYALNAKKRALFVHIDPTEDAALRRHIRRFDRVFCVSEAMKACTSRAYPSVAKKTSVFYNLIDTQVIKTLAEEPLDKKLEPVSLLTVGRLCADKCQDMIPETARKLLDAGYDIHWYLVGEGALRDTISLQCGKHNVADRVILLGAKANPYPYMKACDLYVQPSKLEGWGLTVQEARILQKPIVVSPIPVMYEQIKNKQTGIIVDSITPDSLFEGIKILLDDPQLRKACSENLALEQSDGRDQLQKLYDLTER